MYFIGFFLVLKIWLLENLKKFNMAYTLNTAYIGHIIFVLEI